MVSSGGFVDILLTACIIVRITERFTYRILLESSNPEGLSRYPGPLQQPVLPKGTVGALFCQMRPSCQNVNTSEKLQSFVFRMADFPAFFKESST